ncbi:MAG: hypothetical protein K6G43_10600 [Lachnospiraceae bacterium]|nr:hypothetical protein [Lachnospiraceae bacterium]
MNLSSALTPRDRKLLYALVFIVVIFIFGWCLLRPLYKKIVDTTEKIEIASSLKSSNEAKVIGLAGANNVTVKFEEELAASTEQYYEMMDSAEIDRLVTSYILEKGLMARRLTITMPNGYVTERPYQYSLLARSGSASSSSRTSSSTDYSIDLTQSEPVISDEEKKGSDYFKQAVLSLFTGEEPGDMAVVANPTTEYANARSAVASSAVSGIYMVKIDFLMEGNDQILQSVIDELTHNSAIRVNSFNWITLDPVTYLQEDGTILIYENENRQLQMSVNLYMTEK